MKRLIIALLLAAVLLFSVNTYIPTQADTTRYARADVRTAYFFSERDLSTSLFAVPYTYCIEILRDDGEWYYAKYAADAGIYRAVYGYCRKSDFVELVETPQVTYLYKAVTVTYSTGSGGGSLPVLDEINVEAAFYGTYYSGATAYSYVYCQGSFGYIEGANDDYPLIEDEDDGGETPPDDGSPEISAGLISAIVISLLAAAALIMLYLTTRKRPEG